MMGAVSSLVTGAYGTMCKCFSIGLLLSRSLFCRAILEIFRKSVLGIYLFEIKRVRRITSFWGNELATVLIAVVCIALLIWVTLYDRKNIKLN
jgi:hypothetical protein